MSNVLHTIPLADRIDIDRARCPRCGSKLVWQCLNPRIGAQGSATCGTMGTRHGKDGLPKPCKAPELPIYRSAHGMFVKASDLRALK